MRGSGIEQLTCVYFFMKVVRYPPLVAKLQRDRKLIKTVNEVIYIAKCYTEEDPNCDSGDESKGRNTAAAVLQARGAAITSLTWRYAPRDPKTGRFDDR